MAAATESQFKRRIGRVREAQHLHQTLCILTATVMAR